MSDPQNALKCFQENLRLFADARTEPEKFNLYNGLANLASTLGSLQSEVHQLREEIQRLRAGQ